MPPPRAPRRGARSGTPPAGRSGRGRSARGRAGPGVAWRPPSPTRSGAAIRSLHLRSGSLDRRRAPPADRPRARDRRGCAARLGRRGSRAGSATGRHACFPLARHAAARRLAPLEPVRRALDARSPPHRGGPRAAALTARRVSARIHLWDALRGTYRVRALVLDGARLRLRATPAGWQLPLPVGPPEAAGAPAAAPSVRLDWGAAPRARVRLEPRAGVRTSLRLRQLELTGRVGPDGTRVALWTRGRLDRGSLAFAGRVRTQRGARPVRLR